MRYIVLSVFVLFYSILFEIVGFAASLLSLIRNKRSDWHMQDRRSLPEKIKETNNPVIWLHAASLGEAKILVTILSILEKKNPGLSYLLTAVTESGVNYLHKQKNESVCAVGYLPLDSLFRMNKIIQTFGITRVWLIETEIWPAMLWACLRNRIPVGIINARMEEKSYRIYSFFLWMLKPFFEKMASILAQDKHYAERFQQLGVPEGAIHCMGNIKSYISINRPSPEKRSLLRKNMNLNKSDIVVTFGCLHPDEAEVVKETARLLEGQKPAWKFIVVPRHLNKSQSIKDHLGEKVLLTQDVKNISSDWKICVIDAFGILEEMYMIADAAVIGGTYNSIGGHNVWEAVQYAMPVFFGPDYHTQQESCKRILDANVAFCTTDAKKLADGLKTVIRSTGKEFDSSIAAFKDTINKEFNSLEAYL